MFSSEFSWRRPQTWLLCATDLSIICLLYISCKYDFCWLFCYHNLLHGSTVPSGPRISHCLCFTITPRHITLGTSSPARWSVHDRDFYLTIHNTHKRQTSLSHGGIHTTIAASKWPQTHALNHADVRIHSVEIHLHKFYLAQHVLVPMTHVVYTVLLIGLCDDHKTPP